MKVKELIKLLQEADPEWDVVKSRDEEGNGFQHVEDVDINSSYTGDYFLEVGIRILTPELQVQGYEEEDCVDGEPCVVLW